MAGWNFYLDGARWQGSKKKAAYLSKTPNGPAYHTLIMGNPWLLYQQVPMRSATGKVSMKAGECRVCWSLCLASVNPVPPTQANSLISVWTLTYFKLYAIKVYTCILSTHTCTFKAVFLSVVRKYLGYDLTGLGYWDIRIESGYSRSRMGDHSDGRWGATPVRPLLYNSSTC